MDDSRFEAIENRILDVLGDEQQLPPQQVIEQVLRNSDFSNLDVRRALWRLLSKDLVRLSDEQLLSQTPAREDAA